MAFTDGTCHGFSHASASHDAANQAGLRANRVASAIFDAMIAVGASRCDAALADVLHCIQQLPALVISRSSHWFKGKREADGAGIVFGSIAATIRRSRRRRSAAVGDQARDGVRLDGDIITIRSIPDPSLSPNWYPPIVTWESVICRRHHHRSLGGTYRLPYHRFIIAAHYHRPPPPVHPP